MSSQVITKSTRAQLTKALQYWANKGWYLVGEIYKVKNGYSAKIENQPKPYLHGDL